MLLRRKPRILQDKLTCRRQLLITSNFLTLIVKPPGKNHKNMFVLDFASSCQDKYYNEFVKIRDNLACSHGKIIILNEIVVGQFFRTKHISPCVMCVQYGEGWWW